MATHATRWNTHGIIGINGLSLLVMGHFGHGHFGYGHFGPDISAMDILAKDISVTDIYSKE